MIERRYGKTGNRYKVRLRDPDGREYSHTFRTRKEAEVYERTQRADLARGQWLDPKAAGMTFGAVAELWSQSNPAKRPSALARDESIVRVHLQPVLGDKRIASITPADVQRLVNTWATTQAPRTVRRQYGTLRAILAFAVNSGSLGFSPARGVKLPGVEVLERRLPSPEELGVLADELGDYGPMAWLGAVLGLRFGEVAGLRVGALDFLGGTLSVRVQRTRGRYGESVEGPPKSQAGRRTMTVPRELLDLLAASLAARELSAADSDAYVFVSPEGEGLDYSHFRDRVWRPAVRRAGLNGLTFHDLRRVAASALVAEHVDLKVAQNRLGHADVRMTVGIYARATTAADQAAAEAVGASIMGPSLTRPRPIRGLAEHMA